jgi:hypothetical protein
VRHLPESARRYEEAASIEARELPLFRRRAFWREPLEEELEPAAGHLGQGELVLRRDALGALIEGVGELNLRSGHDVKMTSR